MADDVRDALLALLQAGELGPGDRLPSERDLASRFGVSRTTLRGALRELEMLGYLRSRQGDGTVVHEPGGEAVARPFRTLLRGRPHLGEDLVEFRRILEPEVAALAAERCGPATAQVLTASLERQRRIAARGGRLLDEDVAFHRAVAAAAGNATILHVLDALQTLLREMRAQLLSGDRPDVALAQHEAIARAILAGKPDAARRAAMDHVEAVRRSLVTDASATAGRRRARNGDG